MSCPILEPQPVRQVRSQSVPLLSVLALGLALAGLLNAGLAPSWGTAVQLDGVNDRVELQTVSGFPTNEWTVELWVRAENPTPEQALFSYATDTGFPNEILIANPANLVVELGGESLESAVDLTDGDWHRLAVSWSNLGGELRVYVDGVLGLARDGFRDGYVLGASGRLVLGQEQGASSDTTGLVPATLFRGCLDDLRVWNLARSAGAIADDWNRPLSGAAPGLWLNWKFDEGQSGPGVGAWLVDASEEGHIGSLINRPRRIPSVWTSVLQLNGSEVLPVECHEEFVDPGASVRAVSARLTAGHSHNLVIEANGRVTAWGANDGGQVDVPSLLTNAVSVAAGGRHSLALLADGRVQGWGDNVWDQLTVPEEATGVVAIAAGTAHSLALLEEGTATGWGYASSGAVNVPVEATNLVAIAAGSLHSLGLTARGKVLAWGDNSYGQTSVPPLATDVVAVATTYRHNLALRRDGRVLGWGNNTAGQIDIPSEVTNAVAIAAGHQHSLALLADGQVRAWGGNTMGETDVPVAATNVVAIAAGAEHSLALRRDGMVLVWGNDADGMLAPPESVGNLDLPVQVEGIVDVEVLGDYERIYTAEVSNGAPASVLRLIRVEDTTSPELTLLNDDPLFLQPGDPFEPPDAEATDACAGDLTDLIVVSGSVDLDRPGDYGLEYRVQDLSGNETSLERTVWVVTTPEVVSADARLTGTEGSRSARLTARIIPNGLATTAHFEHGVSLDDLTGSEPLELEAGFEASEASVDLLALDAGVTYHFRVVASNAVGVVTGVAQQFWVPAQFVPGDANGDGMVDQAELDAVLTHYWPYSPWLQMTNVTTCGEGVFQFNLTNLTAWDFTVEVTTNLTEWNTLGPAKPAYQFQDPEATTAEERFYRLRWP